MTPPVELGPDRFDQGPDLVVDRASSPESEIVLLNLGQALGGYATPAGDVLEKGPDVGGLLGSAEGDDEQGLETLGGSVVIGVAHQRTSLLEGGKP